MQKREIFVIFKNSGQAHRKHSTQQSHSYQKIVLMPQNIDKHDLFGANV